MSIREPYNSIKFFSLNTVELPVVKYLLFIIIFLFSFMINISASRGETGKNIKTDDRDIFYKKTKVFRGWNEKGSIISKKENELLLLYPEQLSKKKIINLPVIEALEVKVIQDVIQGRLILEPPKVGKKKSQTPVADSILNPIIMPFKSKEEPQMAEKENKALIFGNNFEQDCYLNKKDCGFPIHEEIKQYSNKISPKKEYIDTAKFPINF